MAEHTPPILTLPEIYEPTDIDIRRYLSDIPGPAVDIGGPSYSTDSKNGFAAFHALNGIALNRELFTANIKKDIGVDILADAEYLPFANEGVAFLLSAYLPTCKPGDFIGYERGSTTPHTLWKRFMIEAERSLKMGGVLVMEGLDNEHIGYGQELGLRVLRIVRSYEAPFEETVWPLSFLGHVIFMKNQGPAELI